ncbi:PadR family transcriptional regulator [Anaerocolumna sedimenticola]|uniref:PadR family transcriptional regulator n=1 Tax=Anaerocolumna sedimenticola TaxID=2696063 RepID=A0A6P1TKE8_9FIRM|nr:PadR family transcriptional regulator [Anaerocolumna sedimenticola]QHQ59758.1 PadR family transcriptional regulator [Anaerocolumna sedimenticola]
MDKNIPLTEAIYYILIAVKSPNHGYGIIQNVSDMTNGRLILGPGTLYGAINTLLDKGWIRLYREEKDSRRKKEYVITEAGRSIFKEEVARLKELIENSKLMEGF